MSLDYTQTRVLVDRVEAAVLDDVQWHVVHLWKELPLAELGLVGRHNVVDSSDHYLQQYQHADRREHVAQIRADLLLLEAEVLEEERFDLKEIQPRV